ncbi:hypothetical protein D9M68_868860 [compost metagenome]
MRGGHDLFAGIEKHKAACAVCVFGFARLKAGLAHQGGLLIPQDTGQGYTGQRFGRNFSVYL